MENTTTTNQTPHNPTKTTYVDINTKTFFNHHQFSLRDLATRFVVFLGFFTAIFAVVLTFSVPNLSYETGYWILNSSVVSDVSLNPFAVFLILLLVTSTVCTLAFCCNHVLHVLKKQATVNRALLVCTFSILLVIFSWIVFAIGIANKYDSTYMPVAGVGHIGYLFDYVESDCGNGYDLSATGKILAGIFGTTVGLFVVVYYLFRENIVNNIKFVKKVV
ncbi:MAG: hypothetical protein LBB95_01840 [Mycoplasmataceae bacterium]|nr:hypothetical protein [Mycoplasmataceae bacterium]